MLSYPYKEHVNICLNMQRFTGAIAKDIAMALKGSLEGGLITPTTNFTILTQTSLSDTGTSLTGTLYSQISHHMHSGAPSTLLHRPLRLQVALYPCARAKQQI
jgi:hypothetical protein